VSDSVWLLWFEQREEDGKDTELLIGIYHSEAAARAAVDRAKDQPGFRDFPQGFAAHEYKLDQDHWTQGFVRR
jgi:homoserine kinase type II